MNSSLLSKTSASYATNVKQSGIKYGANQNITNKSGSKIFVTAGTLITDKIRIKLDKLEDQGVINALNPDEQIGIKETIKPAEFMQSISDSIKTNPVLTKYELSQTLNAINAFVLSNKIPTKILEHLSVFSKSNPKAFQNTLFNLVFGTHIGRANNYNETELNELMSVLLFADIGYARLDRNMHNATKVHPIISKEIVELAGIDNKLILESIMQHEEKLDGTGYPFKLTTMHEYAQISQIVNQYSQLCHQQQDHNNQLGELILLGEKVDFRTGKAKKPVYEPRLQKALINIMQESLQTSDQKQRYAQHLHQELAKIVNWSHSHLTPDHEIIEIQAKIKNTLWGEPNCQNPFQVKSEELQDIHRCQEFITDAMKFLHIIVEPSNYLNRVLQSPIILNGIIVSGHALLSLGNPFNH